MTDSNGAGRRRATAGRTLIGYARWTAGQDLTAQRALGVGDDRIYLDHGLTGRKEPGLRS